MKVRNFAFFGVMAAILSVGAANADTTKRIASTNYVDNKIVNDTTNTGTISSSSTTTAPSEKTVYDAIQNARGDTTELATRVTTIEQSNAYTSGIDSDKVAQIATNTSNIATNASDIDALESGKEDKSNIVTTGLITADSTTHEITAVAAGDATKYASTSAISSDLTKVKEAITAASGDTSALAQRVTTIEQSDAYTSGIDSTKVAQIATNASDIDALESGKEDKSNIVTTGLITADSTTHEITAVAAGDATKYASTSAISSDLTKVKEAITAASGDTTALAQRVRTIEDSDAYTSGIDSTKVAQIATNTTNIATNASDIDALETAVTGLQNDTTTYPEIDIAGNNALANIDGTAAANQESHCSANEPCVLTYEGNGAYKWSSIWGLPTGN